MPATWKRDHTLATAMRHSVVWYFQRVATMLGNDRERVYLAKFDLYRSTFPASRPPAGRTKGGPSLTPENPARTGFL